MIDKILNNTHLYALIAFVLTLAARVTLALHGSDVGDLTNLLYGEVGILIGVPIVNTAVTASANAAALHAATITQYHDATDRIQTLAEAASAQAVQPTPSRGA